MKRKAYRAKTISGAQAEVRRLRKQNAEMRAELERLYDVQTLAKAMCRGVATWEYAEDERERPIKDRGFVHVDREMYYTVVDRYGVPEISLEIRQALRKAVGR